MFGGIVFGVALLSLLALLAAFRWFLSWCGRNGSLDDPDI